MLEAGALPTSKTYGRMTMQNARITGGKQRTPRLEAGCLKSLSLRFAKDYIFGNVTPCCPWYFPPRSLYEVSQTSSASKKITCATPSLA